MECVRCSVVPPSLPAAPSSILAFTAVPHIGSAIRKLALDAGLTVDVQPHGLIALTVPDDAWRPFLAAVEASTSVTERQSVRFAVADPSVTDAMAVAQLVFSARTAEEWCAGATSQWVRDAIVESRLFSQYQPIVDVRTGQPYGFESLLRARLEDGTVVTARSIIDGARRLDLLFQLDQHARLCAVRGAVNGLGTRRLFVNFLPTVIYNPEHCLATTMAALKQSGLRPDQVVFEVVESEQIVDRAHLVRILDYYRGHGFGVALDDVGAGYSSLNLLSELKPDLVKLDMELVQAAPGDALRTGILEAFVQFTERFGIGLIAEGVEDAETVERLRACGITLMQGYHFGRPGELAPQARDAAASAA
ncbi:signal transduction protein [Luteitalea sp. TBR-22]|nr:signal transduction protein [Luteitalea sp. TBR-22]